jgi:DNA modification methylase
MVECACEHCGQEFSAEPEGGHRLLCGSSTESDAVARLMDDERAMLVATDPPYLVDYKGGDHPSSSAASAASRATKNKDWSDTYREGGADEFFAEFIATGIAAAAKLDAPWYIWHADRRVVELKTAMTRCGLLAHQHIIWVKSRAVLTYSHFIIGHESCLYGWLEGHAPPVDRRPPANAQTVWQIDGKIEDGATGVHPTQKPVEIVARPIQPREFRLLEYLMRHPGQLVTRTMLLENALKPSNRNHDRRRGNRLVTTTWLNRILWQPSRVTSTNLTR